MKGIPVKEKNERVSELLQLHQRVRDKMREYEIVLSMAVKFHQLYYEVKSKFHQKPIKQYWSIAMQFKVAIHNTPSHSYDYVFCQLKVE